MNHEKDNPDALDDLRQSFLNPQKEDDIEETLEEVVDTPDAVVEDDEEFYIDNVVPEETLKPTDEESTSDSEQIEDEEDEIPEYTESQLLLMEKFFPDQYSKDEIVEDVDKLQKGKSSNDKKKKGKKVKSKKGLIIIVLLAFILLILSMSILKKSDEKATDTNKDISVEEGAEISVAEARKKLDEMSNEADKIYDEYEDEDYDSDDVIEIGSGVDEVNDEDIDGSVFEQTNLDGKIVQQPDGSVKFSDPQFGISFTYPSRWKEIHGFTLKQVPENVQNTIMLSEYPNINLLDNIRITVEHTKQSVSAKKYFDHTVDYMGTVFNKYQLIDSGELTVSGGEAMYRTYTWTPKGEEEKSKYEKNWMKVKQKQVYIAGNQKMYIVTMTADEKSFAKRDKEFSEILKTLNVNRR